MDRNAVRAAYLRAQYLEFVELLARRRGEVLTKRVIYEHLYGQPPDDECLLRVVDVIVAASGKYISTETHGHSLIESVWGLGYKLTDEPNNRDE